MHGNVWEWCEGSRREYACTSEETPPDGRDQKYRAVRGGSWRHRAMDARSAYRIDARCDDRNRGLGFRFSLRSIKSNQGQVKGGGGAAAKVVSRPAEPGKSASSRGARSKKKLP